jgi:hypothetical protein
LPIVPVIVVVTTIEIVALAPLAMLPKLHVTVPPASEHVPWLGVADTYVTLGSSVSVTTTPVALSGPLFVTVTLYVTFPPTTTGSELSVFVIERSDDTEVKVAVQLIVPFIVT